jgi:uncharacterized damage-inducible protein DinB
MSLQKLITNYTAFNSWANTQFVEWLLTIDEQFLYKEMPSSFTSIDYTVQHILRVQKFWLAFVCEQDVSNFNWTVYQKEAGRILAELKQQSEETNRTISAFTESQLLEKLQLNTPWAKNELCRYEYIMHLINHSTFHRGQIITMARTISITENIPSTDYNFYNSR